MRALLLIEDPLLRDQVRAGLAACNPPLELVCPADVLGRMGVHHDSSTFDWVWLELGPEQKTPVLQKIRERHRDALLLILGEEKNWKWLLPLKEQWKISGFLSKPLDPAEFFRTVDRLRSRVLSRK